MFKWICLAVIAFWATISTSSAQDNFDFLLPGTVRKKPTYFIAAPKRMRPNQVVKIFVTVLEMEYKQMNIRTSLRKQDVEYASAMYKFDRPQTQLLEMKTPENIVAGNYTLLIEGNTNDGTSGAVFRNETDILLDTKQVSVFIQTDRPFYNREEMVRIRVIPVMPNLMAVSGSFNVYVHDASDIPVKRWLGQQVNQGVLELEHKLSYPIKTGTWNVVVDAYGHEYRRPFEVDDYWPVRGVVNVSMPHIIRVDSFGIAGIIQANHTFSGRPCRGNGTINMQIWEKVMFRENNEDKIEDRILGEVNRTIRFFWGRTDFMFPMEELKEIGGYRDLVNKTIKVTANISDWDFVETYTGKAYATVYRKEVRLKFLGDPTRTFKPGMEFIAYLAAYNYDGSPLTSNRRTILVRRKVTFENGGTRYEEDERLVIPDNNILAYRMEPTIDQTMVVIEAEYENDPDSRVEMRAYRFYSPTKNYLQIVTTTEHPMANSYMVFTARTNTFVETIFYQVISKGNILLAGRLEMQSRQKTFSLALSRDMAPQAKIIAFFIKESGEVIADALNFFVNGTRLNNVTISFNRGKDFSLNTVEVVGLTDPSSFVAFNTLDYEIYAKGGSTFITEEEVNEELSSYDSHTNLSVSHTWYYDAMHKESVHYPTGTYAVDSNTTFDFAGLIVFTDAELIRVPNDCNETLGYLPCHSGLCYRTEKQCDKFRDCEDGADELGCDYLKADDLVEELHRNSPIKRLDRNYWHYRDVSWLWKSHYTKPDGYIYVVADIPRIPTSWAVGAISISRELGFGFVPHPFVYDGTRPFYMTMELPEFAVRGEQLGVRLGLFNYWTDYLEVLVTLHASPNYTSVMVGDFGEVSSYKPELTDGSVQTMVYLEAGDNQYLHIPVLPTIIGEDVDITISATTLIFTDTITKTVRTRYDGVRNHYHIPYFLDLISQGSVIVPDFDTTVPEIFRHPDKREHLYVPQSPECVMSVVGDVVGPGMFEKYLDALNVLRRPTGCGEPYMFDFAVNLYTLKYLKATSQLSETILLNALDYMNIAFERQLSYMQPNGSFGMWLNDTEPSLWLTSFVLKTLYDARVEDYDMYLFIPVELLNKITLWICSQQNKTTGAFNMTGNVYDRNMAPNITMVNGKPEHQNITLTAYVIIALAQSNRLTGEARQCAGNARDLGSNYLARVFPDVTDPYAISIITYALHLVGHRDRGNAFNKLVKIKFETEFLYWASKEIPLNPSKIVNTVPMMLPRDEADNFGQAVAATSYALMVYLMNNRFYESKPIMKFIQTQRLTNGGFASTQDTIIAIQALTEYALRDSNRDLYNVHIRLEATSDPAWTQVVKLNKTNFSVMQSRRVTPDKIYGQVKALAQGTGLALIQMDVAYNVEYEYQVRNPTGGKYFDLEIDSIRFHGFNFSNMEAVLCARWARPDLSPQSGLAVMEVELPTGFMIVRPTLDIMLANQPRMKWNLFETSVNKLFMFFENLNTTKTCAYFHAERWYPVANTTIQHIIKVYDYYEPGQYNATLYRTWSLFNLNICRVCGSFQCPYCPFYNSATVLKGTFALFTIVIAVLARRFLLRS